jgi:hypothetical protein
MLLQSLLVLFVSGLPDADQLGDEERQLLLGCIADGKGESKASEKKQEMNSSVTCCDFARREIGFIDCRVYNKSVYTFINACSSFMSSPIDLNPIPMHFSAHSPYNSD